MEQKVRDRIASLSYLPTTTAVAMKFMELGKNPDADPSEYAKVISSDASLSTKILSLANSSWFGVRNRVTKPQVAVNLLGLGTIRTLAISYCLTGLHNDLALEPNESKMFWSASLCKAVAAKQYAAHFDSALGEEAFTCGIFQDFAISVMYSLARQQVGDLLSDSTIDAQARLQKERAIFRLDHCEIGRIIAQKLELPELFIDAVAFHHHHQSLREFVGKQELADATYIASLFPHKLEAWNKTDADAMVAFLAENTKGKPLSQQDYLARVQKDFNQLFAYFEQGAEGNKTSLADLLAATCKENADNTTRLITCVHDLMGQAASAGKQVHELLAEQDTLAVRASTDSLTQILNREAFITQAREAVSRAQRYGMGYALAFLDIDRFKQLNDGAGHVHGDKALQHVGSAMLGASKRDVLMGRVGGDEFAIFIPDVACDAAAQIVTKILTEAATEPANKPKAAPATPTLSAGLLYVAPRSPALPLETLLSMADGLMYQSKRAGGNRLTQGTPQTAPKTQSA
jgi:diguanylate cyclase (GGDEF)-like protein